MREVDIMVEAPGPGDQISVMICESSQVQLRILSKAVEEAGYRVQTARSAEAVLEQMQAMPADILLTGIEVGAMTGLEACWALKANPRTESVHTIVITASGQESRLEESLDAGAYDFIRKPVNMTELRARLRAASRLVRMQKQFRQLAETDSLTGVANRRALMQCLEAETAQARSLGTRVAVVMLDLDHFKRVNDTHGHAIGDRVLVETVKAVQACLSGRERLGRLGGEEFIIVLPDVTPEYAALMAERVRQAVEALQIVNDPGELIPVTASIGVSIATAEGPHDTPDSLLLAADDALYEAKETGRNRVIFAGTIMPAARRAAG
ncbi:GGDEF domain-containing protein [Maricaulis sp.]|uniref:GGDEF domain-containing protein n=1 Tax=Maricaulis sp. TaxID=1486257 RepID=UPI003A8E3DE3